MKLKWYGHSCFSISFSGGPVLVTDPFDETVGYPLCTARANYALTSHDHFDHNHVQSLAGNPLRIADSAPRDLENGVRVYGIDCFHDEVEGAKRGKNVIFVVEGEGLRLAHLGDLGHMLTPRQLSLLGRIDVLLIPIGGTYTITTEEAVELIREIRPHTAVAMHFQNDACHFSVTDESEFVRLTNAQNLPAQEIEITPESLSRLPGALVLEYPRG